jgi:hypothetical protein
LSATSEQQTANPVVQNSTTPEATTAQSPPQEVINSTPVTENKPDTVVNNTEEPKVAPVVETEIPQSESLRNEQATIEDNQRIREAEIQHQQELNQQNQQSTYSQPPAGSKPIYGTHENSSSTLVKTMSEIISQMMPALIAGALLGAFLSDKFRPIRKWIGILAMIAILAWGTFYTTPIRMIMSFIFGFVVVSSLLRNNKDTFKEAKSTLYGSAEWATLEHLQTHHMVGENGLFLGDFYAAGTISPLSYSGDRHLLTIAPTRSGKGVSAIIPNLLTYQGSVLVIDPKGENALITASRRGAGGLGQNVHIVDPWGIAGKTAACFNPFDWLKPDDEDINENAMMLADSIITPAANSSASDPFWNEEAKALLMKFRALYVHRALLN